MKGYGIGDNSKVLTSPDLNTLLTGGFYYCTTPTNSPSITSGFLTVEAYTNNNYIKQTYIPYTNTGYFYRTRNNGVWGDWKTIATVDQTQITKITSDSGGVKLSISDTAKNLLTELVALGTGYHTFYCVQGTTNNPSTKSVRGIAHFTQSNIGWAWCTDYNNNLFTNYYDTGNAQGGWTGWRSIPAADVAQMWKLTQDNGYVIDSTAETDVNNLSMVGFYNTNNTAANLPTAEFYKIITLNSSSDTITQIAIGNNTAAMYTRNKRAGVWGAWVEFVKLSSNGQLNVSNQSNISALKSGGTLNLTSGVDTKLTSFVTEYRDTQNEFDPTLGEITVKEGGLYVIGCQINLSAAYAGGSFVKVYKNGVAWLTITVGTDQQYLYGTVLAQPVAGDKLTFYVVQNSGSTGTLSTAKIEMAKIS